MRVPVGHLDSPGQPLRSGQSGKVAQGAFGAQGGIGLAMEKSAGQIYPQGWEFYAVTGALFLTFAFPGFVYRYLVLRHRG